MNERRRMDMAAEIGDVRKALEGDQLYRSHEYLIGTLVFAVKRLAELMQELIAEA